MPGKNIVILDGTASDDKDMLPILDVLSHLLQAEDAQIVTFPLREMKLAHCIGCFGCWVKTPGICVDADDGREIVKAIVRSDVTVLFTPVTFGGYSAELKKMVDRFIPIASPFFQFDHGEVHHPPRYTKRPRLLVVGVQRNPNAAEARIFITLAGRNAINFHSPSYAAQVVSASDEMNALQRQFEALLIRSDALPFGDAAASLMPAPVTPVATVKADSVRRALLILGSPKTHEASTSGALGGFLLDCIEKQGWETESLTLRASLNRPEGEAELLSAVKRAGLILFVFPLYVDALPYLVTKAMAVIAAHRRPEREDAAQRVVAVVNSGFPEAHQNSLALAICREFTAQSGRTWAGGLAFGAGGMIGGQSFKNAKRQGPPIGHVIAALKMTAASLVNGLPVSSEAVRMISKTCIPFALFCRLYVWMGAMGFKRLAAKNGISKARLLAQPYSV
jgi:multimeric flavodoxin WrbA